MLETQSRCTNELRQEIATAVNDAVDYLKANKQDPTFDGPYALALLSYALALHNPVSPETNDAFDRSVCVCLTNL